MPNSSDPSSESPSSAALGGVSGGGGGGARLLRRHHQGVLIFGERRSDVRFIIEPEKGRMVLPIESVALSEEHWVVIAPDEVDRRMEVLLEPHEIERPEAEACVDRWRAYFGDASSRKWASCTVLGLRGWFENARSGKDEPEVFDAEALSPASTLIACESRLLKLLNSQRDRIGAMCRVMGAEVADPLCVGVDQFGLDIRARFGVMRAEFAYEATDEARAKTEIERMLNLK